jgi:phosphatidate cytidylyltransferase
VIGLDQFTAPIVGTIAGVFGLLVAAMIVTRLIGPSPARRELRDRVRSWWVMVTLIVFALALGRIAMVVFFGLVSYLALKEYFTIAATRRADRLVLFFAYLAVPVQYTFVGMPWYGMFLIFIPVYMFLFLPSAMVIRGETEGFLKAAGTVHWGLMTTVFAVSHAAYLLADPPVLNPTVASGAGLLILLLLLTELNDVAQYVAGKLFGRTRITPTVSPKKTLEGLVGGIVVTLATSLLLAPLLTPLRLEHAAFIGLLLPVAGFLGDLTMSAMKRDLGIKDAGTLIPGHGGVLDRIDSLTFTAPLFFHFVRYFYG